MHFLTRPLLLLILLAGAGCTKASDVSLARRDHLLAEPHGWIDLTLHAPAPGAAASAPARARNDCQFAFGVNGETMMQASGDLAQADAASAPLGYRFVAPAGGLKTALTVEGCVDKPLDLSLPVTLEPNHLALLEFDGKALAVASTQLYAPATLEAIHGDVATLQSHGGRTDGTLATLTRLVAASLLLNVVVLAALLLRKRV